VAGVALFTPKRRAVSGMCSFGSAVSRAHTREAARRSMSGRSPPLIPAPHNTSRPPHRIARSPENRMILGCDSLSCACDSLTYTLCAPGGRCGVGDAV